MIRRKRDVASKTETEVITGNEKWIHRDDPKQKRLKDYFLSCKSLARSTSKKMSRELSFRHSTSRDSVAFASFEGKDHDAVETEKIHMATLLTTVFALTSRDLRLWRRNVPNVTNRPIRQTSHAYERKRTRSERRARNRDTRRGMQKFPSLLRRRVSLILFIAG